MSLEPPAFPDAFRDRLARLVDDVDDLLDVLRTPRPTSIRVNTLKADVASVRRGLVDRGLDLEPVPWTPSGFRVQGDVDVGLTLEHFLGHVYVQSAASMLPPRAVADEVEGARVLDGCAAPGSKSTQLAALMDHTGLLVANDRSWGRTAALKNNLDRCGVDNHVIAQEDLRHTGWETRFDVALVDAPCTGEGIVRKSWSPLEDWSVKRIHGLSGMQRLLIEAGFDLVRPGGTLVYSTCTFAPEENEAVVDHLLRARDDARVEPVGFEGLDAAPGVTRWDGDEYDPAVEDTVRVWPHLSDTDGFYVAKIRRTTA